MKYLVDANVLSEATKPAPSAAVVQWLRTHEAELAIDAIVLAELRYGILILPASRRRRNLERWFDERVETLVCLPWDSAVALRWAELLALLERRGEKLPRLDSMIAATALTHGLTVATRNTADFRRSGVPVVNPFEI
ncbi:MAG: type II toxin-antitoxin system VapC family toxin [Verrucomicrobia bacterium]|nr:type II toxin-antitoxin system VapC family toxin [Verrucomicrobiota bacterium]